MKNVLKISLLALLLFISAGVYAYDETFSLKVKSNTQKSIVFYVKEAQDVEFSIYGSDNEILYKQEIRSAQPATKTYDLEAFPDGNYVLKLETGLGITEYKMQIEYGKASIEKPLITQKLKPILTKQNAIVTLDMLIFDKEPIEIKIVNEHNDQLYSNVFTEKNKLCKKFNIGKTDARELTFIVKTKGQEFVETVSVN